MGRVQHKVALVRDDEGTERTGVMDARSHCSPISASAGGAGKRTPIGRLRFHFDSIDADVVADFHWNREEVRRLEVGIGVDDESLQRGQ
jgi:hypothetical protein